MAWLYKRPDSKFWWIGWRVNGKQVLKSTGTDDRAQAEGQIEELKALRLWKQQGKLTKGFIESLTETGIRPRSLHAEFGEWLAEAEGSTAPATLRRYKEISSSFLKELSATEAGPMLADVDTPTVRDFLTKKRTTLSASTTNLWRTILSVAFGRAVRNGSLRLNPVLAVKPFKAGRDEVAARRAFTLKELQTLHQKAPDDFWRYMVLAGFFTGLRLGDLVTLKWGNVDFAANALRVQTRKTSTPVYLPLRRPLRVILEQMAEKRGNTPATAALWPTQATEYEAHGASWFSQTFTDILATCGLATKRESKHGTGKGRNVKREQGLSFHCLRHSFVSTLAVVDGSKATGMALAGHSSETVNDGYTHLPPEVLAAAIAKLPDITGTE